MKIKPKYYPYPIMDRINNSYKEFAFIVKTEVKMERNDIVFAFEANVEDKQILELINYGKAVYAYHIQCAQTCFRAAFTSKENKFEKYIAEDKLNGIVEVCPFIVANENLKSFASENFSSDYTGFTFNIKKGGILAIGDQSQHVIEKDMDSLNNSSSIFVVCQNPDINEKNMSIYIREKKISVILPHEQYGIYCSVGKSPSTQKSMHAMIFVPALMAVLMELKNQLNNEGNFGDYDGYLWIQALENVSKKIYGINIEEALTQKEPLELAQVFLKNPMNNALEIYRS